MLRLNKSVLLVVHVLDDSPATGVLQLDDVIIGANGWLFEDPEDPRPEMGGALCESQSPELGGILTLHVVRDRKPLNLKSDLGSTLSYSDTWPMDCEKTRQIRRAALDYVIKSYPWDRRDFWTPTFLLASGDDAALELARRHLCAKIQDDIPEGRGGRTWSQSYRLINFCEYYLLFGDSFVLPAIRYDAQCLAWAQYRSGSWSHGGGGPGASAPGNCDGGYGEINCAGLGAFVGLCLARQCGIEPYDHTLPRSIRFFGKFCGTNFPYGLGTPGMAGGRMDNGMNSMAAIGFHLLGEDEMARRWARTVCCMWMARERGHAATGLVLSMKVVNDDVYEVLRAMAKLEGTKIDHCVRYGIKDPAVRTELSMELINTANRSKSRVPSDYKPLNWAVGAHLDLCEPYLQTAVDTLNNPEVLMLYGFFSQGPPNNSLRMLFTYHDNPLVLQRLPDILRFGARKREKFNHYWVPCIEYPHRIVIKLGPEALPVVEAFCKSERELYRRIQSGQEEQPVWWKEDSVEFLETWCDDMQVTAR